MNSYYHDNSHTALTRLRALIPNRHLSFDEAMRLAELQANRLLELSDITDAPVPDEIVLSIPGIRRWHSRLKKSSGAAHWTGKFWIVVINSTEPQTRQRFTLLHEFKHVIDHRIDTQLYRGDRIRTSKRQAELAADYFAGCVLVPKRLLRRAWYHGEQRIEDLARRFDVSTRAIEVRLSQVGLTPDLAVEQRPETHFDRLPIRPSKWYFRASNPPTLDALGVAPCPN